MWFERFLIPGSATRACSALPVAGCRAAACKHTGREGAACELSVRQQAAALGVFAGPAGGGGATPEGRDGRRSACRPRASAAGGSLRLLWAR